MILANVFNLQIWVHDISCSEGTNGQPLSHKLSRDYNNLNDWCVSYPALAIRVVFRKCAIQSNSVKDLLLATLGVPLQMGDSLQVSTTKSNFFHMSFTLGV